MPPFQSKPLNPTKLQQAVRKYPTLFGIPLVIAVVGASFLLTPIAQIRYDLHDERVKQVMTVLLLLRLLTHSIQLTKEQQLGLEQKRKKFDIREEYYRLSAKGDADWDSKRIPRPKGLAEWGEMPEPRKDK
ncbi:cytochrome c oxidase assembly protein COX16-domain-containing protein [Mycena floridula]|nr:cytochrome c oxidase assembly protein COX16-domain-containing protein [Mycena floridula]